MAKRSTVLDSPLCCVVNPHHHRMLAMSRGIPVIAPHVPMPRLRCTVRPAHLPIHYRKPMRTMTDACVGLPTVTHIEDKRKTNHTSSFPEMLHLTRMLYSTKRPLRRRGPAGLLNSSCNALRKPKVVKSARCSPNHQVAMKDGTWGLEKYPAGRWLGVPLASDLRALLSIKSTRKNKAMHMQ
jgi:hypothetical protein